MQMTPHFGSDVDVVNRFAHVRFFLHGAILDPNYDKYYSMANHDRLSSRQVV